MKKIIPAFLAIYAAAIIVPSLALRCLPAQSETDDAATPTTITIPNTGPGTQVITIIEECPPEATLFRVNFVVDENQDTRWVTQGSSSCFNYQCETSWSPATGRICLRCPYPICEEGFEWRGNEHCDVPKNKFEVDINYEGEGTFWEGCIIWPTPNECLMTYPNNYRFTIKSYCTL